MEFLLDTHLFVLEAKSTLKPFIHGYWKSFEERNFDKVLEFFHPDAVIVEVGRKGTYGKEAIKKQLLEYDDHMGRTTMKVLDEHYQMTEDYIIFGGRYETQTEKAGLVKGKLKVIWKKLNDKYLVIHDEYTRE